MAEDETQVDVKQDPAAAPQSPSAPETWTPLAALRQKIDRMFDDFDIGSWNRASRRWGMLPARGALWPASGLVETDESYQLGMELPGLTEKDVELKVNEGTISLRGEKTEEHKEEKMDFQMSERSYGAFQRAVPPPHGVDSDKIGASFTDGVLTVTLPTSPEARQKERRVEVKKG